MNAINTANYNVTPLEIKEETNYYVYNNVFKSGINVPAGSDDINYYIGDPTGTKILPLMKVSPTDFSTIKNIEIVFKFYSVEGGVSFVPPALELWLVMDPNNSDGTPLSKVGATMKTFDFTTPITVGNIKEYRVNFNIPATFYPQVPTNKTFNSTGVDTITNWSDFVNTINGTIANSNTVYYFGLTTATVSAAGKGWFEIEFNVETSRAGSCEGCSVVNKVPTPLGDCFTCETKSTDSTYWTVV